MPKGRSTNLQRAIGRARTDWLDGSTDSGPILSFTAEQSSAIFNSLHVARAQPPARTVKDKTGRYPWELLPSCKYIGNINFLATFRGLVNQWHKQQEPRTISLETLCSYMGHTYGPEMVDRDIILTKKRFFGPRVFASPDELGSPEGPLEDRPPPRTRTRRVVKSTPIGPNKRRRATRVSRARTRSSRRKRTRLEDDAPSTPQLSDHDCIVIDDSASSSSDTGENPGDVQASLCPPLLDTTPGGTQPETFNIPVHNVVDQIRLDIQNELRRSADAMTRHLERATTTLSEWKKKLDDKRKELKDGENELQWVKTKKSEAALAHAKSASTLKRAQVRVDKIVETPALLEAEGNGLDESSERLTEIRNAKSRHAKALGAFNISRSIVDEWIRRETEEEANIARLEREIAEKEARAPSAQAQESDSLSLSSGPHNPIDDNPKHASTNYDAKPLTTEDVDPDHPAPTEEERQKLRKVAGYIPWASYLLCIVELAERASFYGVKTVFNNYIQFPLPKGGNGTGAVAKDDPNGHAGALNKGLQFASAMVLLFQFLAYIIPIFGAWLGDTKTGRFRAIMYGVIIGGVAHVILVGGAAPSVLKAGNGLAPFMISFFLLAIGAGLFKPNVVPLIVDQYRHQKEYVKTLKSGERVLVDPETTVQRIMLLFYMCINVGAFFMIATTYIEKYAGFWLAFLVPGVVYILLPALLMWRYKTLIRTPPQGSDLNNFIKIVGIAIKENKGKLWGKNYFEPAKPSALAAKGTQVSWTNKAVDDARRTLSACQIFLYLPIFFLGNGGVGSTGSNQGASMTTKGAPNDLLHNFNPLTLMVVAPLMTYVLYPFLHRRRIKFGAISRMTFGYTLATIGGISGTIVQYRVYKTSPCGYYASTCDGVSPISIWWQLPNVMLGAMGELFCTVTAYELAYARSPPGMKSIVVSISLAMQALSAALAQILIPAIKDPHLIWAWAAPAIALFVQTVIFWFRHHHINEEEFMTYEEEENVSESEKSQRRADAV
ncbi:hypothetical protein FDECE_7998 [Fusarium decemcellulare]|nr:hypothetical protein FDECE_7998 [Fusarium decemcellulare]